MLSLRQKEFLQLRKDYISSQFKGMNSEQLEGIFCTQGPLLLLAGAGSGKTTVIINRIYNMVSFGSAYCAQKLDFEPTDELISRLKSAIENKITVTGFDIKELSENPIAPYNIMAITFTNKAAGELKSRLIAKLGAFGADVNASTFHSACVRILRRDIDRLGFAKSFTIYDSDDQQRAIKEIYKLNNIDEKFMPLRSCIGRIGRLKDKMIAPEDVEIGQKPSDGLVATVYAAYQKRLKQLSALDFDDLIYYTVKLLREHKDIREHYQNRFKYVLVDEYQDTSHAQFCLVQLLAGAKQNVCVVGDDDQSIYRFRGATIENILSFEDTFANTKTIKLEQNYRSTSNILNAANGVISHNYGRKGKTLFTKGEEGELISLFEAESEFDEAAKIGEIIAELKETGATLNDFAVLYRMNAQSNPVETYFARAGIPYKIVGGMRFYDRKEVKDVIAYMSVVLNRQDDLRLKRIINMPARGIGATTVEKLTETAHGLGVPILDVLSELYQYPSLARSVASLSSFMRIYNELCSLYEALPLDQFVQQVIELSGYKSMLEAENEQGETRLQNLSQLISSVNQYVTEKGEEATLQGFLEDVALISDLDSYNEDTDQVIMMTVHSSKGLEFDNVFIVGMEDGIFPSEMSKFSPEEIEEERRLCYVALTRAKKRVFLSVAQQRMIFGQTKRNRQSKFIDEIPQALLQGRTGPKNKNSQINIINSKKLNSDARPMPQFLGVSAIGGTIAPPLASKLQFSSGEKVHHKVFGAGIVQKVTPISGDNIVEILFEGKVGLKKTMANYAPLTKM